MKSNAIDWTAVVAAKEPEQIELDGTKNYYTDPDTLREYRRSRPDIQNKTWEIYKEVIQDFGDHLDAGGIYDVNKQECDAYLIQRRDAKGPGSARALRSTLLGFGKFLEKTKRAPSNPWSETDPEELQITEKYAIQKKKQERGLYELEDVANILLAIQRKDVEALAQLIH